MNARRQPLSDEERAEAAERRAAIAACHMCDENGWLIIADLAHRCDHQPPPPAEKL